MDKIWAGQPTIELAKLCYQAGRPLLLWGRHGTGKSELLKAAAEEMEIGYLSRDLSLMEPTDLTGLPKMDGTVTKYLPPAFLPTSGKGLLVFEELNRCDRYVRTPCLQLLTARCLNDYVLPAGWLPMAAINPPDEDYEVFELDRAFTSRFIQATLVPDQGEWLGWAGCNSVHPAVLSYVESDATVFDSPASNPRAWKYVSDVMRMAEQATVDRKTLRAAVVGLVGNERGVAFLRTLKQTDRPLTAEKVLGAYGRHRAVINGWIKAGRTDLLDKTVLAVGKYLQPKAAFAEVRATNGTSLSEVLG
jgi:MoxR-like ATPase